MGNTLRAAVQAAVRRERDPAVRRWLTLLVGDGRAKARKTRRRAAAPLK